MADSPEPAPRSRRAAAMAAGLVSILAPAELERMARSLRLARGTPA